MRVVGADGLQFLAFSETVFRFLALKITVFTVPFFQNGLHIFCNKCGSRSQISTNLEIKLRTILQDDMILEETNFHLFHRI